MSGHIAETARNAARQLTADFGQALIPDVEAALAQPEGRPPDRYFDPISLGALIVSVTSLAWTVYQDMAKKAAKPAKDVVARRVRVQLETSASITSAQRDQVIDVVVTDIFAGQQETD